MADDKTAPEEPPFEPHDLIASAAHVLRQAETVNPGGLHVLVDTASANAVKTLRGAAEKARKLNVKAALDFAKAIDAALDAASGKKAAHISMADFGVWRLLASEFGVQVTKPKAGNLAIAVYGAKSASFEYAPDQLAEIDALAGTNKSN
jgi:hypothetical protein